MGNVPRKELPAKQGFISRPRVDKLLEEAMAGQVALVQAPPGYGKTNAIASFARSFAGKVAWMRASKIDNITARFWQSFTRSIGEELPALAKQLEPLGFPNTLSKLDTLTRILAKTLYEMEQPLLFVLDDANNLSNGDVLYLLEYLIEAELENLNIIFITSQHFALDAIALKAGGGCQFIGAEDLRLHEDETAALFASFDLELSKENLQSVYNDTEGWPVAVFLVAQQVRQGGHDSEISFGIDLLHQLFLRDFFSSYSKEAQKTLVRLSLLPDFPIEMVSKLCESAMLEIVSTITNNLFITFNHISGNYVIHNMYRDFLQQRSYMLLEREILEIYRVAGDFCLQKNQSLEAVDLYFRAGEYQRTLQTMLLHPEHDYSVDLSAYFMRYLEQMPTEFCEQNPLVDYLRASVHLNNLQLEDAKEIFLSLENRLADDAETLGEVYIALAAISIIENSDRYAWYYQRAVQCLPGGSKIKPKNMMVTYNANAYFPVDNRCGAPERSLKIFRNAAADMQIVFNGGSRGLDDLFEADLRYLRLDVEGAKAAALHALYKAQESGLWDIALNAHGKLLRIAIYQGDYGELMRHLNIITSTVNEKQLYPLYNLRDTVQGLAYVKLGDVQKIPSLLQSDQVGERNKVGGIAMVNIGRERLIYALYLLHTESYREMAVLLELIEAVFKQRGAWYERYNARILQAICFMRMGGHDLQALEMLHQAYEMGYPHGLVAGFVEAGKHMRALVDLARRHPEFDFAPEWLEEVYKKASAHAKHLAAMQKKHAKTEKSAEAPAKIQLSRREMSILHSLASGLTRNEIAREDGVSVNTVKSSIKSIYNKLGAVNRADAVRTAISIGLIKE